MKFENFYADMGERPEGMSIGRIDNDGDYSPENCRWETRLQQQSNTSFNKRLEIDGESMILSEVARKYGKNKSTFRARLASGWSVEDAAKTPINEKFRGAM
jgi:hypothetical protein